MLAASNGSQARPASPRLLHREDLWRCDVAITTGLVDTYTTPTLLRLVISNQLDAARFITHPFTLDHFEDADAVFARAGDTGRSTSSSPAADPPRSQRLRRRTACGKNHHKERKP